jgi:hypothetical protein
MRLGVMLDLLIDDQQEKERHLLQWGNMIACGNGVLHELILLASRVGSVYS